MKLKELQSALQEVQPFREPKIELEQYITSPHIASRMLFTIDTSFEGIEDRTVVDLGCGGGMLSIGALLLGAGHVVGVDIDSDAIELAMENCENMEVEMEFVQADITHVPLQDKSADIVLMNPPFGSRTKGADMMFLQSAIKIAREAVYSLHKTSTRAHIEKAALKMGASQATVIAELRYDLPATYKFHKKKEVDIEVDLWRFEL